MYTAKRQGPEAGHGEAVAISTLEAGASALQFPLQAPLLVLQASTTGVNEPVVQAIGETLDVVGRAANLR